MEDRSMDWGCFCGGVAAVFIVLFFIFVVLGAIR